MEELSMRSMYRILVIGSPGAGKSTLSSTIEKILNIKCYHLDDLYWLGNWKRPKQFEWLDKINALINKEEWIIDGNYYDTLSQRLARSNFVVYLNFSTGLCLYRIIKRALIRRFVSQDSLPKAIRDEYNRPKIKINFKFFKLVLFFKMKYKRKIIKLLEDSGVDFIEINSKEKKNIFIDQLKDHDVFFKKIGD